MAPFHTWAIDTIVRLKPGDEFDRQYLVVCVDVFTKWIEYGLLKDLSSKNVTSWVHRNIVCRFGSPFRIRCDNGSEYKGVFKTYCEDMGI